eukprot:621740-Prymnesium_polylepis.1
MTLSVVPARPCRLNRVLVMVLVGCAHSMCKRSGLCSQASANPAPHASHSHAPIPAVVLVSLCCFTLP